MTQSLQLGGSRNDDGGRGIRRVNRVPIVITIVIVVAFLAVVFLGLLSRGLYLYDGGGIEESGGAPASTLADRITRGVPDGIIGEPEPPSPFQPAPPAASPEPVPAAAPAPPPAAEPQGPALEPEHIWRARLEREHREQALRERHRQQMARLQANDAAYDAPIAVDRGKLAERGESGSSERASSTLAGSSAAGSAPDLLTAALRAGLGGAAGLDPNGQSAKEDFLNADLTEFGYLPNRVLPQLSQSELKRGSVIPATLITGINSDLPGRITAQVSRNVYDSATGHRLLIPQGTKLFGRYDSKVAFGQSRVLVVWTDLIFPDGATLQIGGMAGTDAEGYGGFRDRVDRKWPQTFGSAALVALIGAGTEMAIPQDRDAFGSTNAGKDAARRNFADTFGRVADRTIQRNLDVQPTLEIRPGYAFNVLVDQDIVFPNTYPE